LKRFKNKTVLITGAGSGIGKSTALRLDKEGATLIIVDINEEHLNTTKKLLSNKRSSSIVLDISNLDGINQCFETVKEEHKKLDALINVAGILRFDNSHEVKIEDWNKILNVNLTGTSRSSNAARNTGIYCKRLILSGIRIPCMDCCI
jgi:NADP-dependent 3-hydroxy acid dehydrogenase YdfG